MLALKRLSFDKLVDNIITLRASRNFNTMVLTERKDKPLVRLGFKKRLFLVNFEIWLLEKEMLRKFRKLEMCELAKIVDATGGGLFPLDKSTTA